MTVLNNKALRNKLDSISQDIKVYVNMNAFITDNIKNNYHGEIPNKELEEMSLTDEQNKELLEIRIKVMNLATSIKNNEKKFN